MSRTIQEIVNTANQAEDQGVPVNWREITRMAMEVFQAEYNASQALIDELDARLSDLQEQ